MQNYIKIEFPYNIDNRGGFIMKDRKIYALVGVVGMLFCGLVYAWSILKNPIAIEFDNFTNAQLSSIFTFTMCSFCLGVLSAGILAKRYKLKYLLWLSGLLFLLGFYISSLSQNIMYLYIGFSVLSGFASGFSYNLVISSVSQWFLDKKGFISGLLLMGFGFSSFVIGKIYQSLTPEYIGGWRLSFQIMGIGLFVVLFIIGRILKYPEDINNQNIKEIVNIDDYSTKEMIKTLSFWSYFIWATLLTAVGLILVSQASGLLIEVDNSISKGSVSTIVGLVSILNGVGRIIFGILFDKLGYRKTIFIDLLFFASFIIFMFISLTTKNVVLIVVGFILGGLSYGGVTPLNSAIIREFYGNGAFSVNFSIINMNLLISSFGSTMAGYLFDVSQSYFSTLFLMLSMIIISVLFCLFIKKPKRIQKS